MPDAELAEEIRGDRRRQLAAAVGVVGAGPPAPAARGVDDADLEQPRLGAAGKDVDDAAAPLEIQAGGNQHRLERLAQGQIRELARERAVHRRVEHDAERRASEEHEEHVAHGERVGKRQRAGGHSIEIARRLPVIESCNRERGRGGGGLEPVNRLHPDRRQIRDLLSVRRNGRRRDRRRNDGQPAEDWKRGAHLHTFSSRIFGSGGRD